MLKRTILFATLFAAFAGARAQTLTADNNYVIEDTGTYSSDSTYFNFGLTGAGVYKSFGVLDFSASSLGTVSGISSAVLTIEESDYTSTSSVPVDLTVYAVTNNTISLATGQTNVEYNDSVLGGLTNQLGTATQLGTFVFNPSGLTNGGDSDQKDTINLTTGLSAIASEINSGQVVRLVITTNETGEVTLTGAGSSSAFAPTLALTPAPEPASMLALTLGIGGLIARKRRK